MKLEHHLVLTRWLHDRLGADGLEDLKRDFQSLETDSEDQVPYLETLLERDGIRVPEERLREYDARIRSYERRLSEARGRFSWKYFQYLALLHVEIFLDALTEDPARLVRALNEFLADFASLEPHLDDFPEFESDDLRRLALFMATGSGKTLLLHANLWQVFHYLEHGHHPEALVRRPDSRSAFDNVLLITPKEGLSEQHMQEFRRSGIDSVHLAYEEPTGWLFGPQVRVIEISKLAKEVSGEGLSIPLEALGTRNLVFVDEGHKGVGSDAQKWKRRQRFLSEDGFLLEYSATFAQSVAAAPVRSRRDLLAEYGKSIVFDYSYRHFYNDGYGKRFEVLNLESDQGERAHELLVGGLLTFYLQTLFFETDGDALHQFRIERPLWVFLGAGVVKTGKRDLSEVATVVTFLRRFLEEPEWAKEWLGRTLRGETGFTDSEGEDLFAKRLERLAGSDPNAVYKDILKRVFHGRGALEVWELKRAEGELGLRVSGSDSEGPRYFGLVSVGDSGALRRHLEREAGFDVHADELNDSLFPEVDNADSPVNVLIGSRKFIEGWSSWRVSAMGLLNMGRGEGPQVIQLFGRGVRLKGKNWSLKRSTGRGLPEEDLPDALKHLETLYIFGWNADYIQAFRDMMEVEEVGWELEIPVRTFLDPIPELYVPQPENSDAGREESWILDEAPIQVELDLTPRVTALSGDEVREAVAGKSRLLDFSNPDVMNLVDVEGLYVDLLHHKNNRGYGNLFIRPKSIPSILARCDVTVLEDETQNPERVQEAARRGAVRYLDRFMAMREREAECAVMEPVRLELKEKTVRPYRVRGTDPELREQVLQLMSDRDRLFSSGGEPLPRLHVSRHLYSPLLLDPKTENLDDLSVSPAGLKKGEVGFVKDLMQYWKKHRDDEGYAAADLYLLRNLPHSGVGFFKRSGFYPDFILWVDRPTETLVQFVEPHGMHHGGLKGNKDKIEALLELERLSEDREFQEKGIRMSGYIVTETSRTEIPDVGERSWEELRTGFRVLPQATSRYVETILQGPS